MSRGDGSDPEHEALLADSVRPALLVVLDTLTPAERLTFVLHDMFAVPFDEFVDAFLGASRGGDFDALLALLDPDVVVRADSAAVPADASPEVRGAEAVADTFAGRARAARPALVDGSVALVWAQRGRPRVVFGFTITHGKILEIELVADPDRLGRIDLALLHD